MAVISLSLNADYYMAEVKPYQTHTVEAEVSGIVKNIALNQEFSFISKSSLIVEVDTENEDIQIQALTKKIDAIKEVLSLKRENLRSKSRVRQISKYELNSETLSVVDTKISLISTEMELKLQKVKREKKLFYLSKSYLGKIYVDEFEYVNFGERLFEYYDFFKSRLDLFVTADEVVDIRDKSIFLNGKKSKGWKIEKVSQIKDSRRVSTYQVRLIHKNRDPRKAKFGEIYKVEFR